MPDQSSAADEHALIQEITAPLSTLPDDPVPVVADAHFPVALRGYDRLAVDAYVRKTSQLVAELQATRSPEAAIRRALERVGEQISGILQRAHETAEQITAQSRREAEDRLEIARTEGETIRAAAEQRVRELDAETDRIWAERHRIVDDARELAQQLLALAEAAAERFPAAEEEKKEEVPPDASPFDVDAEAPVVEAPAEFGEPPEFEPRRGPELDEEPAAVPDPAIGWEPAGEDEVDPERTAVLPRYEDDEAEETRVQDRPPEPPDPAIR